jgi:hypothetical protein
MSATPQRKQRRTAQGSEMHIRRVDTYHEVQVSKQGNFVFNFHLAGDKRALIPILLLQGFKKGDLIFASSEKEKMNGSFLKDKTK